VETSPPSTPSESRDAPSSGDADTLGRFVLGPKLRTHLCGDTFRAQDSKSGSTVALTMVHPDLDSAEAAARLEEAVGHAAALGHKSIALVYACGREGNRLFVVSEDTPGDSLRSLIERKRDGQKFYTMTGACNVALHVLAALEHAHAHLAHGALTPSSILVTPEGRVKLMDFGLGTLGPLCGGRRDTEREAAYLAPESRGDTLPAPGTDLYSVGVLIHELLTGEIPTNGMPAVALPAEIGGIVKRCLSNNPGERYADARALKDAILSLVGAAPRATGSTGPQPSTPPKPPPTPTGGMAAVPRPPRAPTPVVGVPRVPTPVLGVPRVPTPVLGVPRLPTPVLGVPLLPKGPPTGRSASFAVARAGGPVDETAEKWLVHKDRLDFGPFSLAQVKQQIREGKLSSETVIVDQSTGVKRSIGEHPLLSATLEEASAESERRRRDDADRAHKAAERRTRLLIAAVVSGVVLVLVGAGVAVVQRRKPTVQEKIVYREKEQNLEGLLKGIDIAWKVPEPPKKRGHRGPRAAGEPGEVYDEFDAPTELGDASQGGGDEQLTTDQIQKVMRQNFGTLTPCVLDEKRRDASLHEVQIEFLVKGTGKVSAVRTNGQRGGPLADCMLAKMKMIGFPPFNGPQTRAGFSMSLR
jgi:protein kinase-like protein